MSLTNKERGRLDRLKDRCHVLQARLDANTAGKQDWEQELSALSWAVAKIEAFPPEALRSEPVDPESEAANPVWDLVIAKCHSAYPERQGMSWGESPLELITEIIDERDRLREIEHAAWHLLDDSETNGTSGEVTVLQSTFEALSSLLPEGHPDYTEGGETIPSPRGKQ